MGIVGVGTTVAGVLAGLPVRAVASLAALAGAGCWASSPYKRELERLGEHFRAWRASTLRIREERWEQLVSIGQLKRARVSVVNADVVFAEPAADDQNREAILRAQARIGNVWDSVGAVVILDETYGSGLGCIQSHT